MTLTLEMVAGWLLDLHPDVEELSGKAIPHYEVRASNPRTQFSMGNPTFWVTLDCTRNVRVVYPYLDVIEGELNRDFIVRTFMGYVHELGHVVQESPYTPLNLTLRETAKLKRRELTGEWKDPYSQWREGSAEYLAWSAICLMLSNPDALAKRLLAMFGDPGFDLNGAFVMEYVATDLGFQLALLKRAGKITELEESVRLPGLDPFPEPVGRGALEAAEYYLGLNGVPLYQTWLGYALGSYRCGKLVEQGMTLPELLAKPIHNRKMPAISRG